eukprot:3778292-Pleurochrysis_carterae.AAC.1
MPNSLEMPPNTSPLAKANIVEYYLAANSNLNIGGLCALLLHAPDNAPDAPARDDEQSRADEQHNDERVASDLPLYSRWRLMGLKLTSEPMLNTLGAAVVAVDMFSS